MLRRHPAYVFPAIVLFLYAALVVSGLSGSSVGELASASDRQEHVVTGSPKSIRRDEWFVRTPFLLGQVERGFPAEIETGIGRNDTAVLMYLPTSDWSMVFKPQLWGFLVLPTAQGFAFDWWGSSVILLLGIYAFLQVVIRNWRWATVGAIAVFAAPFFHWWYLPTTLSVVGFVAGGFAALLIAVREPTHWLRRSCWAAAAGFAFVCSALLFYPPFLIPSVLVFGAVSVAVALRWWRRGALVWWGAASAIGIAGFISITALGLFVLQHRAAFDALSGTVYPGRRRVLGGDGLATAMYSNSWFSWLTARDLERMQPYVVGNASEDSSFPMLGLFMVPSLPFVWRYIAQGATRLRYALIATLAVLALFFVHIYFRLPSIVGRLTLLDRVPTYRLVVGVGLASMLLYVFVGAALQHCEPRSWRRVAAGSVLTLVTVLYVLSLGRNLRAEGAPVSMVALGLALLMAAAVSITFFWKPLFSVALLAVVSLLIIAPVNPLYRGVAPLRNERLKADMQRLAAGEGAGGWVATTDDMRAFLTANGFTNRSGVNFYPDASAWKVFDPSGKQVDIWNRYEHIEWDLNPNATETQLTLVTKGTVRVTINPCSRALSEAGVTFVVRPDPLSSTCFESIGTITSPRGERLVVSRRTSA